MMGQPEKPTEAQEKLQCSLRKEILQLEERLQDQFLMRRSLEKALGYGSSTVGTLDDDSTMPKPMKELITEIAVLEFEVVRLEHHLLSLYRKILSNNTLNHSALSQRRIDRSQSALSQLPAVHSALQTFHSQPLSDTSEVIINISGIHDGSSEVMSLAKCLGTRIADHVPETANRLSEDLVRCMGSIYWRLGESANHDGRLEIPFQVEGLREFGGPYNSMIQVHSLCTSSRDVAEEVDALLEIFRSIVRRFQNVDVKNMKNEEKLAFWINVHNALVMHAYIHQRNLQLKPSMVISTLPSHIKASCNIGGRIVSADIIKTCILCHRGHRPGQWIRTLLSPRLKLKAGVEWQSNYAIRHPEPLVHFALCSGNHSDPALRIYHPKKIFQQLETAKQEYIRAIVSVCKQHTILLPKMLESFAKDSSLCLMEIVEMIQLYLPETLRIAIHRCQVVGTSPNSCIDWANRPHNFTFRYILSRELAGPMLT